jgi:hypothetical protein
MLMHILIILWLAIVALMATVVVYEESFGPSRSSVPRQHNGEDEEPYPQPNEGQTTKRHLTSTYEATAM